MPRFLNKGVLFVLLTFAFIWIAAVFAELDHTSYTIAASVSAVLMLCVTMIHYMSGGDQ